MPVDYAVTPLFSLSSDYTIKQVIFIHFCQITYQQLSTFGFCKLKLCMSTVKPHFHLSDKCVYYIAHNYHIELLSKICIFSKRMLSEYGDSLSQTLTPTVSPRGQVYSYVTAVFLRNLHTVHFVTIIRTVLFFLFIETIPE